MHIFRMSTHSVRRVLKAPVFALCLTLGLSGCSGEPGATSEETPKETSQSPVPSLMKRADALARASVAFREFGEKLKQELQAALAEGGPVNAVNVCAEVAPTLAQESSEKFGFPIGRSSHRVRNTANAPFESLQSYLQKYAESGAGAPTEVFEESGSWVVIAPIVAQPLCLTCHGDPSTFSPELKSALATRYPDDKATGFEAGDLRGVFWATLPRDLSAK